MDLFYKMGYKSFIKYCTLILVFLKNTPNYFGLESCYKHNINTFSNSGHVFIIKRQGDNRIAFNPWFVLWFGPKTDRSDTSDFIVNSCFFLTKNEKQQQISNRIES